MFFNKGMLTDDLGGWTTLNAGTVVYNRYELGDGTAMLLQNAVSNPSIDPFAGTALDRNCGEDARLKIYHLP